LADNLPSGTQNIGWLPTSNGLHFTVEAAGKTDICWLAFSNGQVRKTSTGTLLSGFSVAQDGRIAAVSSGHKEPGTLVTFKPDDVTKLTRLVDVNADVLSGVKLGEAEELWYTSKDGLKVQGWLVKPAHYEAGKKYPMVLWIHGGPWSMYSTAWNWAFQNWSALGYAVLYTNPRGSTGYGQEFVNGIQYSYPGKDYDDLMAGVDAALGKGFIDDKNLFVCGGSGGGVLTAWIVGHTDRFAAAVSMRPVIDWHSFVGTTDGANWYYQFQKRPWEDPMEFAVRSPLHYVANVKTPTMVMTGEADLRTPMSQSEEYYRALKMLKKETLLVRMPDEYHGWRRPSHQLAQQLYLQAWFEKHARKEQAAGR
jgi:dipeptidyl aminopeptidase/acylaminoacyl peptidase